MDFINYLTKKVACLSASDEDEKTCLKLRRIKKFIIKSCSSEQEFRDALGELNSCSLDDPEFATKVAIFTGSKNFEELQIFGHTVRCVFIDILHKNYEEAFLWKENDLERFYNSVQLYGEFYNGIQNFDNYLKNAMIPIVFDYLHMLLSLKTIPSAKEIISQLMLNGPSLSSSNPHCMKQLTIALRKTMLESTDITYNIWLMVAVEYEKNQFNLLDDELKAFYIDLIEKHDGSTTNMDLPQLQDLKINPNIKCSQGCSNGISNFNSATTSELSERQASHSKVPKMMNADLKVKKVENKSTNTEMHISSSGKYNVSLDSRSIYYRNLKSNNIIMICLLETFENLRKKYFGDTNTKNFNSETKYPTQNIKNPRKEDICDNKRITQTAKKMKITHSIVKKKNNNMFPKKHVSFADESIESDVTHIGDSDEEYFEDNHVDTSLNQKLCNCKCNNIAPTVIGMGHLGKDINKEHKSIKKDLHISQNGSRSSNNQNVQPLRKLNEQSYDKIYRIKENISNYESKHVSNREAGCKYSKDSNIINAETGSDEYMLVCVPKNYNRCNITKQNLQIISSYESSSSKEDADDEYSYISYNQKQVVNDFKKNERLKSYNKNIIKK